MEPYDRAGNPISTYPDNIDEGVLLGINNDGYAVYLKSDNSVVLALTVNSTVQMPPPGFGRVHEISLDAYNWDLEEYIRHSITADGDWRVFTARATQEL